MGFISKSKQVWANYTPTERRNIAIYIIGIMFYKFGLEAFNGSITTLAIDRFGTQAFRKQGLLQGLNQAFQCVGSILIAPLIKRFPTRSVLAMAVMVFGLLTAVLMIVDASTGGRIKRGDERKPHYGNWNPDGLFPVYCASGIAYGMVELIRRVIPRDIVGGDVNKLRRMDAIVHIFYEIAGTVGAFTTTYLVLRFGNNYSFFITPIFFTCACILWSFVSTLEFQIELEHEQQNYFIQLFQGAKYFGLSIWVGAKIIFSNRKFIWLPIGYSMALYGHRYLENGIAPIIGKQVFKNSAYSQILVGGSNFGELLGAFSVFILNDFVPTPIPWLRLDSFLVLIVWAFPFYYPPHNEPKYAWLLALVFMPISIGWAAGDVSLAAYIQACLARHENESDHVSALGAVMAFLYSTYILIYAILSPVLGGYVDRFLKNGGTAQDALKNVGGIQFTVICAILLASTFIPAGAFAFNPKLLFGEDLTGALEPQEGKRIEDNFEMMDSEKGGLELPAVQGSHKRGPSFDEKTDMPMAMAQAAHASY
ncbi:MFS general substrate transporter [Terfezia boudieri ATCC MYA-4762]|uniref:MFS general substrate transporter n=1 Tax=Terfezia boudieri ATCC MYA-4762 TaxID=1051890 RepID=A0A3N4M6Y9_9PEZI|nr:MFS general substrate transporter [Terfezia boudieri ATCC MYA-4762]